MEIQGAVVLVTGAAAGLGRATVDHLHNLGARVCATDRSFSEERIEALLGQGIHRLDADIADADAVDSAVQAVKDAHGRLDAVIHCAGVADGFRLVGRDAPADPTRFRRVVDVNLFGTFNILRSAAWRMKDNEPNDGSRGVIVLTSSIAAFEGQEGQVAYSASKAAVVGMTLPAARDLAAFGIRCVTIAPGAFATALTTELAPELQDRLTSYAAYPRRLGRPEEYAMLVEAVLCNEMLNGETIRLDGGSRLGHSSAPIR